MHMNRSRYVAFAAALLLGGCAPVFAPPGSALDAGSAGWRTQWGPGQADFERIVPGQWTRADVERTFGPPALIERVASWDGPIMTYRWRDAGGARMFYSIYLDSQGVVRRAHPSMEVRDRLFDRF